MSTPIEDIAEAVLNLQKRVKALENERNTTAQQIITEMDEWRKCQGKRMLSDSEEKTTAKVSGEHQKSACASDWHNTSTWHQSRFCQDCGERRQSPPKNLL